MNEVGLQSPIEEAGNALAECGGPYSALYRQIEASDCAGTKTVRFSVGLVGKLNVPALIEGLIRPHNAALPVPRAGARLKHRRQPSEVIGCVVAAGRCFYAEERRNTEGMP